MALAQARRFSSGFSRPALISECGPLPSTPVQPHALARPREQLWGHRSPPLIPAFKAQNSSNLQPPQVATLPTLSHSPKPGSATRSARGLAGGGMGRRPCGGVRTHQPKVQRSRCPRPGRGAVGYTARPRLRGRGSRGDRSFARTPNPAPRGGAQRTQASGPSRLGRARTQSRRPPPSPQLLRTSRNLPQPGGQGPCS